MINEVPFTDEDPINAIPAGKYKAEPSKAELREVKDNPANSYAYIEFKILTSPYIGKIIFGRYNVKNDNVQAQQIAQATIRKLYRAVNLEPPTGVLSVAKLEALLRRPFILEVGLEYNDYRGEEENIPKKYISYLPQSTPKTPMTYMNDTDHTTNAHTVAEHKNNDYDDDDIPF